MRSYFDEFSDAYTSWTGLPGHTPAGADVDAKGLDAVGAEVGRLASAASAEVAVQERARQDLAQVWTGAAAEDATAHLQRQLGHAADGVARLESVADSFSRAARGIENIAADRAVVSAGFGTVHDRTGADVDLFIRIARGATPAAGELAELASLFGADALARTSTDPVLAARELCRRWLDDVFVADYETKASVSESVGDATDSATQAIFATLGRAFGSAEFRAGERSGSERSGVRLEGAGPM